MFIFVKTLFPHSPFLTIKDFSCDLYVHYPTKEVAFPNMNVFTEASTHDFALDDIREDAGT